MLINETNDTEGLYVPAPGLTTWIFIWNYWVFTRTQEGVYRTISSLRNINFSDDRSTDKEPLGTSGFFYTTKGPMVLFTLTYDLLYPQIYILVHKSSVDLSVFCNEFPLNDILPFFPVQMHRRLKLTLT